MTKTKSALDLCIRYVKVTYVNPRRFFDCNVLKTKKHYILEVYYITKQVHVIHVASTVLFLDNI